MSFYTVQSITYEGYTHHAPHFIYHISRNIDSDFNLVVCLFMIAKLNVCHSPSLHMQAWVSFYTVIKAANLKSCQQCFLSKLPNIMFTNISVYTAYIASFIPHQMCALDFDSSKLSIASGDCPRPSASYVH